MATPTSVKLWERNNYAQIWIRCLTMLTSVSGPPEVDLCPSLADGYGELISRQFVRGRSTADGDMSDGASVQGAPSVLGFEKELLSSRQFCEEVRDVALSRKPGDSAVGLMVTRPLREVAMQSEEERREKKNLVARELTSLQEEVTWFTRNQEGWERCAARCQMICAVGMAGLRARLRIKRPLPTIEYRNNGSCGNRMKVKWQLPAWIAN